MGKVAGRSFSLQSKPNLPTGASSPGSFGQPLACNLPNLERPSCAIERVQEKNVAAAAEWSRPNDRLERLTFLARQIGIGAEPADWAR